MAEQYKVAVPIEQRVKGNLYDFNSGAFVGLASDEQKAKHGTAPFKTQIAGCPHTLVIHG